MANYKFDLDLPEGQIAEQMLTEILQGKKKVEVKRDFKAFDTGNVAVEYWCRGKRSGICKTEADWYAFVLAGGFHDEVVVFIATERLKCLCRQLWPNPANRRAGGDDNASKMVLVPIKSLLEPL